MAILRLLVRIMVGVLAASLAAGPLFCSASQPEPAEVAPLHPHVLGHFVTPVLSAAPGRVHNIGLAAAKIDGRLLQPGETFSFNAALGPRDRAHGWAQAREIFQGEFVMGYGGGICQVSSTLYNAALLAGLEIVERHHHQRPLEYAGPGRDATVAWGQLDFRFRNSLPMPVRLRVRQLLGTQGQVEVALVAAQPASRQIALEEADRQSLPPLLEEELDLTLPPGTSEVVDWGLPGVEVKLFRVISEGGQRRRELVSHDRYPPKNGRVKVGYDPAVEELLETPSE